LMDGNLTVVSLSTTDGAFRQLYVDADITKQVIGTESGATYNVLFADTATNYNRDEYAANDIFETEADAIIDFSETNPFGMP
jgi:formylmethanofuran dehydrogenase subunit B